MFVTRLLTMPRIDDDSALGAKVQEAMNVYDEYMKQQTNGTKEEDKKEGAEASA